MGLEDAKNAVEIILTAATLIAILLALPGAYKKVRVNPWLNIEIEGKWVTSASRPLLIAEVSMKNMSATKLQVYQVVPDSVLASLLQSRHRLRLYSSGMMRVSSSWFRTRTGWHRKRRTLTEPSSILAFAGRRSSQHRGS